MPVSTGSADEDQRPANHAQHWLARCGKMGELILAIDWSSSPLGPIDSWPQSLCTTVSLCLASNFPISLAWGAEHTQIYNEGYAPICGDKHPRAIGQNFAECWASAWPVIGEAFELALEGKTSFLENQRMFLDRNGYLEETFFTFSFSPIRDENGVAGLFHPVTETSARMLSERRTHALRELGARFSKPQTVEEACALAIETLADFQLDLPVLVLYLFEAGCEAAKLVGSAGLAEASWANLERVELMRPPAPAWPLEAVHRTGLTQEVLDLPGQFGQLYCGVYPESIQQALVMPLTPPGCTEPLGALAIGVSPRLPFNEAYRAFCDLVAGGVTNALANARAFEQERERAEALAEIDRAKTHFFSNVSHEFRTPLTLILGPLEEELAEKTDRLPDARRDRLAAAHRNGLRLLKLVNNLLDFSRIEAGRMQAHYEATELSAYTAELASVFRSAIEKAGLTLAVDCPALPEPVFVDRGMWEKVVLNLLSNALKHTFSGSIAVTLKWCGEFVELAVTDTGVGIAAAELPHLFERFHRVTGSKSRSFEGTGIGLALVRELAGMHGGTVTVHSEEDRGSTFIVRVKTGTEHLASVRLSVGSQPAHASAQTAGYVEDARGWITEALPAAQTAKAAVAGQAGLLHTSAGGTEAGLEERRPRILLVDDNADMRDYVTRLLAEKYEVEAVGDGLAALLSARAAAPDLVLTDVMMPGLDGFGLLRALREDISTQRVPVVLLSARAGQEQAIEGLQAGADDYLVKPFSAQELLARVYTHLAQARIRRRWVGELEQSNKELETFSYSLSHDLRTPLRALDGFSRLLLENHHAQLDEQGRHYLDRVRCGAQKMSDIINSLLSLSRVSRGVLHKQTINLSDLARRILAGFSRRDPLRDVAIEVEEAMVAIGDRRLLMIALLHLLDNAWKYTARGSSAVIAFGHQTVKGQQIFFVRDNGVGFESTNAGELFKPFHRLHPAQDFAGIGIGLAIVHRVIARHGGRIWAEAAVNSGAAFYFTLGEPG